MLLAGLQGHAQRSVAPGILGHANDAPGHGPFELVTTGKIRRMRATKAHGHAKALGRAQHHIGALLARRHQHYQAEQVGSYTGQCLLGMQLGNQRAQVAHFAMGIGVLQQSPEYLVLGEVIHSVDDQFEAEAFGTGLQHREGLRMAVFIGEEGIAFRLGHALGQGHGFRRGGGFVE
ncbi:hypothetical protein D3C80_1096680 [compost metagenome]